MNDKSIIKVSDTVIRRLPKYRRCLEELLNRKVYQISSQDLSKIIGFTASQIRQDLNVFGGFGLKGFGYNVQDLYLQIEEILGIGSVYNTIIIGAGNLGQAIVNYTNFCRTGFLVKAMFDINPKFKGLRINDVKVIDAEFLKEYLEHVSIDIGIICTNKESAQEIAKILTEGGVKGIWNFAPVDLAAKENVIVENVHLSDSLYTLAYYINHPQDY